MSVVDLFLDPRSDGLAVAARARTGAAAGGIATASGVRAMVRSGAARQGPAGRPAPLRQVDVTLRARIDDGGVSGGICVVCLGSAGGGKSGGHRPAAPASCDLLVRFEPARSTLLAELMPDPGGAVRPVGCRGRDGRPAEGYATRLGAVPQTMRFLVSDGSSGAALAVLMLRLERDARLSRSARERR